MIPHGTFRSLGCTDSQGGRWQATQDLHMESKWQMQSGKVTTWPRPIAPQHTLCTLSCEMERTIPFFNFY